MVMEPTPQVLGELPLLLEAVPPPPAAQAGGRGGLLLGRQRECGVVVVGGSRDWLQFLQCDLREGGEGLRQAVSVVL